MIKVVKLEEETAEELVEKHIEELVNEPDDI